MTTAAAPPAPPSISSAEQAGTSRLARMTPRAYRTLLLGIGAAAAAMAAEGIQTIAEMRERHFVILARQDAAAPVPYHARLPALHALAPAAGGAVRVWLRADAAGPDAPALCALADATAGAANVRWIALSPAVEPCLARRNGAVVIRAGGPAAAEFGQARWIVADADGRALYSRRDVPAAEHLRRTEALLAPMRDAEAAR